MKLIIIRHAETTWNNKHKTQGKADIPLSSLGKRQASLLGKRFSEAKIDAVYSSMLQRSIKTAEAVARHHPHIALIKAQELNEMNWGKWEGLTFEQIARTYPKEFAARQLDKFNIAPPQGESPAALKRRITPFLRKMIDRHKNQTVLVVGHAGMNRVIIGTILGWSEQKTASTTFKNTSVTILHVKKGKSRMRLFNCTSHLETTIAKKKSF
jgi:broad specificity phosphatase PhoE